MASPFDWDQRYRVSRRVVLAPMTLIQTIELKDRRELNLDPERNVGVERDTYNIGVVATTHERACPHHLTPLGYSRPCHATGRRNRSAKRQRVLLEVIEPEGDQTVTCE